MASHKKFNSRTAFKIVRHIERLPHTYRNKDVDLSKSHLNTTFIDRGYEHYKGILDNSAMHRRKDLVTLCGVVVTLPQELNDLTIKEQDIVFSKIIEFLQNRYGEYNTVSAIVHRDEAGQPHLHFTFVPIVKKGGENPNKIKIVEYIRKYPNANNTQIAKACGCSRKTVLRWKPFVNEELKENKVCASDVVNLTDLKAFHTDLERFLNEKFPRFRHKGKTIGKLFHSGITKIKGNKTVEQLKEESLESVIQETKEQVVSHNDDIEF